MKIRQVLFATDFSERTEAALPHALWYARDLEVDLIFLATTHGRRGVRRMLLGSVAEGASGAPRARS